MTRRIREDNKRNECRRVLTKRLLSHNPFFLSRIDNKVNKCRLVLIKRLLSHNLIRRLLSKANSGTHIDENV